jgi:hypothetical protein
MNNVIERPSMVLLIDCWSCWDEPTDRNVQECLKNIKNFCWNNPYVHSIGLASYWGMDPVTVSSEEPWHSNAKELFYNTTRWEHLRDVWNNTCFDSGVHTHSMIRDLPIRHDQTQFSVWNADQLLYYCNHVYQIIENIYVFGIAWDVCLESRPVGWKELCCLNQYDMFTSNKTILSDISCTLDQTKNFRNEVASPWIKLYNNTIILDQDQL